MDGHKAWLKRGFDDGVFLLASSREPSLGGILATIPLRLTYKRA